MIPVISEIKEFSGLTFWKTNDGRFGTGFEITACDLETENSEEYHRKLVTLLRSFEPNLIGRIQVKSERLNNRLEDTSRSEAFAEIGYVKRSVYLFVESQGEPAILSKLRGMVSHDDDPKEVRDILNVFESVKQSGLKTSPLSQEKIESLFIDASRNWVKGPSYVSDGTSKIGVVRLLKPTSQGISEETLALAIKDLPQPFELSLSFKKLDQGKERLLLERRLKQNQTAGDSSGELLRNSTIEAIQSSIKNGSQFIEYEFLVLLVRDSESKLSEDTRKALSVLSPFGDFQVETFGVTSSWLASLLGNSQHVTSKELDEVFPLFMPLWFFGENEKPTVTKRSLTLLRQDSSAASFDLFDVKHNVCNAVIVGTSGKGKSVLTGLLTQSLLNDPNVTIIKLDVGGSHSKECELLGGTEHVLQLNEPSGINPFSILFNTNISEAEKVGILSRFLSVLILEQGEVAFSKDLRSQIESSIQHYLQNGKAGTLQEFYDLEADFPRRNLLKRWCKGGIFESAFKPVNGGSGGGGAVLSRLCYYNFSQVFQASDPEFSQAGLAAVLAQFNIESLANDGRRIVLICDETPFFIRSCFEFFKFSTANVRKFGHAVVLITQLSTDLIVNDDTGIIENSPQRFLFSVDGLDEDFAKRLALSSEQVASVKTLRSVPTEFSEVYLQTGTVGRKLSIKVTREEYWTLTSSQSDKNKMAKLRCAVPELTLKEAIKCLSAC